jgi:hypothetical protein
MTSCLVWEVGPDGRLSERCKIQAWVRRPDEVNRQREGHLGRMRPDGCSARIGGNN